MNDINPPISDPQVWLDQHGDALYRFAMMRVRSEETAEDLVQETLLAALRARSGFAGRSAERTWLIAILKNKIVDHFRRASREVPLENELPSDSVVDEQFRGDPEDHWTEPPAAWNQPEMAMEQAEFWQILQHCLKGLPDQQSRAFLLCEMDGLSTNELCKALNASTSNVWVLLHRARLRLRDCLAQHWFDRK